MGQTLDQFASECHDILKQDSSDAGLEKVRQGLEKFLVSDEVLKEHLGPDADSERKIIYEDDELGFCILAHVYKGPKTSSPHDHGPAWAIYGQAVGQSGQNLFHDPRRRGCVWRGQSPFANTDGYDPPDPDGRHEHGQGQTRQV
jgi:predicted metal-dependent enzyme (double-stranded beta helix superfamily)